MFASSLSVHGSCAEPHNQQAVVIEETLPVDPRDFYDVTKLHGEAMCAFYTRQFSIPTIRLRIAKSFYDNEPSYQLRKLYRGVDARDVAQAIQLATESNVADGLYAIAALSPFTPADAKELWRDAAAVIRRYYPQVDAVFRRLGWKLPRSLPHYVNIRRAEEELNYSPRHNFGDFLNESMNSSVQGSA